MIVFYEKWGYLRFNFLSGSNASRLSFRKPHSLFVFCDEEMHDDGSPSMCSDLSSCL